MKEPRVRKGKQKTAAQEQLTQTLIYETSFCQFLSFFIFIYCNDGYVLGNRPTNSPYRITSHQRCRSTLAADSRDFSFFFFISRLFCAVLLFIRSLFSLCRCSFVVKGSAVQTAVTPLQSEFFYLLYRSVSRRSVRTASSQKTL